MLLTNACFPNLIDRALLFHTWPGSESSLRPTQPSISPNSYFVFWPCQIACRVLVPQPGIEPRPPTVEALSPNHWTTSEIPKSFFKNVNYSHFWEIWILNTGIWLLLKNQEIWGLYSHALWRDQVRWLQLPGFHNCQHPRVSSVHWLWGHWLNCSSSWVCHRCCFVSWH